MTICTYFNQDTRQCEHSANVTGACEPAKKGKPPRSLYSQHCSQIHLVGYRPADEKVTLECWCRSCDQKFHKETIKRYQAVYTDVIDRGIVVCCRCHQKRVNETHGTWTITELERYQQFRVFEEFQESHPELTLNQDPEDWYINS